MKTRDPASAGQADLPPNFDIVNGFLNRCRGGIVVMVTTMRWYHHKSIKIDYLAEISSAPRSGDNRYAGLSLMVWILKREVRAFGGCLGMYRR